MEFVLILFANFPEFTMHGIGFVIHLMIFNSHSPPNAKIDF